MKKLHELTEQGKLDLENELETLKTVDRPRNIEAIKEARAQGDLSENADYDAAREEQRRIEQRIFQIEEILKNSTLIEQTNSKELTTGKTVTLEYVNLGRTLVLKIVDTVEANPANGRISNESPLGKALMGHSEGDLVVFVTETGKEQKVKIKEIK